MGASTLTIPFGGVKLPIDFGTGKITLSDPKGGGSASYDPSTGAVVKSGNLSMSFDKDIVTGSIVLSNGLFTGAVKFSTDTGKISSIDLNASKFDNVADLKLTTVWGGDAGGVKVTAESSGHLSFGLFPWDNTTNVDLSKPLDFANAVGLSRITKMMLDGAQNTANEIERQQSGTSVTSDPAQVTPEKQKGWDLWNKRSSADQATILAFATELNGDTAQIYHYDISSSTAGTLARLAVPTIVGSGLDGGAPSTATFAEQYQLQQAWKSALAGIQGAIDVVVSSTGAVTAVRSDGTIFAANAPAFGIGPVSIYSAGKDTAETFTQNTDGSAIYDLKNLTAIGDVQNELTTTASTTGQATVTYSGQGGTIDLSNSAITLGAGSSATINGIGNAVTEAAGATVIIGPNSINNIITMATNGTVVIDDGASCKLVNVADNTVTIGHGASADINEPAGGQSDLVGRGRGCRSCCSRWKSDRAAGRRSRCLAARCTNLRPRDCRRARAMAGRAKQGDRHPRRRLADGRLLGQLLPKRLSRSGLVGDPVPYQHGGHCGDVSDLRWLLAHLQGHASTGASRTA